MAVVNSYYVIDGRADVVVDDLPREPGYQSGEPGYRSPGCSPPVA